MNIQLKEIVLTRSFASFDIFDTCLIRRCGLPHKIWDLMADQLFEKNDVRGRLSFTGNRSAVEKELEYEIPNPTLKDIYDRLNVSQWRLNQNDVMDFEMAVEEQELFPNPEMLALVNQKRANGFRICFVSDMYLPSVFLKKILKKYGFFLDEDLLFVSAECNATKREGSLYDFILKETSTKGYQWIHYGDDEVSDFSRPRSKGIKSVLVKKNLFTEEECRWIENAQFYSHKHEIELWAGICRKSRIEQGLSIDVQMAVDFIASVYIPYVKWVCEEAKKKNVKDLFFLGRDGHVFYELAKNLADKNVNVHYLKISRRAIYSAYFFDANESEIKSVFGYRQNVTVGDLLTLANVNWNDLSDETKRNFPLKYKITTTIKSANFCKSLLENERELLKNISKKNRPLLLQYLEQEGVFASEFCVLIDLGWYGSGRCFLNNILRHVNKKPLSVYYWGCFNRVLYGEKDDELNVFLSNACINKVVAPFVSLLTEHYASSNGDGTVVGYNLTCGKIQVIEEPCDCEKIRIAQNQECCVRHVVQVLQDYSFSIEAFYEIFLCCGYRQILNFKKNPSKEIMRFFKDLVVEDCGNKFRLVRKFTLKDVLAMFVWGEPSVTYWKEAAMKKTFGIFSSAFTRMYHWTSRTSLAMRLRVWWDRRK